MQNSSFFFMTLLWSHVRGCGGLIQIKGSFLGISWQNIPQKNFFAYIMHLYDSCQELVTVVSSWLRLAEAAKKLTAIKMPFRVQSPSCHIKPQHIYILILSFIMPHVFKRKLQTICAAASKKRKGSLPTRHPKDDTPKDNTPNGDTPSNDLPNGDTGQPKGVGRVLLERGLWVEGLKKKKRCRKEKGAVAKECRKGKSCCAFLIIQSQSDFMIEISLLETTIRNLGHEYIFYPKFHCEFNFIEFFGAAVKRYTRAHCDYSFARLETTVRAGLDSVSLQTIRRFSMRSKRWMIAYRDGGTGSVEREFAEKLCRSHRRESKQLMIGINSGDPKSDSSALVMLTYYWLIFCSTWVPEYIIHVVLVTKSSLTLNSINSLHLILRSLQRT